MSVGGTRIEVELVSSTSVLVQTAIMDKRQNLKAYEDMQYGVRVYGRV
jgi:hypothetical protein